MNDGKRNTETNARLHLEDMWFKLREIEQFRNRSNQWELRLQFIESHMLLVVASGQGWVSVDGRFTELRSGSVYVCLPGQLVEAAVHSMDERGIYHLRFDVIDSIGALENEMQIVKRNSRFPVKGEVIGSSPVTLTVLCDKISLSFNGDNKLAVFRSQILFQELLYRLFQDAQLEMENESERMLERAKAYIEQNYDQELTIEQLAKVSGVSPRHFMRLFKKKYGYGAIDYVAIFRIKQAQQIMKQSGNHRLRDIARHVGYDDDTYFRRKFKQVTGVPPAAFMKNSRLKIVAYHPFNIGQLLALEVTPCAAPADHPWTDYYGRKYQTDSVLPLTSDYPSKQEAIKRIKPDFIIGVDPFVSSDEQAELRRIAPSYFVPWPGTDWREHLRLIARFLDKSGQAETWLEHYERKVRILREQMKKIFREDDLLILRITGERCNVLGNGSLATVLYDDLRIMPARGVDRSNSNQEIELSELANFDANRMLFIVDEDDSSRGSRAALVQSEIWNSLKSVKGGLADFLPPYPWTEYTAFTHDLILDEVRKLWRDPT